jgi:Sigma-70, region 4
MPEGRGRCRGRCPIGIPESVLPSWGLPRGGEIQHLANRDRPQPSAEPPAPRGSPADGINRRWNRRGWPHDSSPFAGLAGGSFRGFRTKRGASNATKRDSSLPAIYREVFPLRDVQELNIVETAAALSISVGNVKVRLHRARMMLQKQLASRWARVNPKKRWLPWL